MNNTFMPLAIILTLGLCAFYLARRTFELEVPDKEITLWRNTWVGLTVLSFLSNNYLILLTICAVVLGYLARKSTNRFAFFLAVVFIIPSYEIQVPGFIWVSYQRIAAIAILIPVIMSRKLRPGSAPIGRPLADKLLITTLILIFFLTVRGTTTGDALRTTAGFAIDWFFPYFVASRMINNFEQLKQALIALVVAATVAGSAAIFEHLMSWPLYTNLQYSLGVDGWIPVLRGGALRARSTMDHPLSLALVMMIAFGVSLILAPMVKNKKMGLLFFGLLCLGFYAPLSRGPWAGAGIIVLLFTLSGKKVLRRLTLLGIGAVITFQVLSTFPAGQKIIKLIPFIGTSEQFNVEYRQELIPRALQLLSRSPLFGEFEPTEEPEFHDMVQGEKIVDIVNTYILIGINYGYVGLVLFIWFFINILRRFRRSMKYIKKKESEHYLCGRGLLAIMLSVLITLTSVSFMGALTTVVYAVVGLMYSYARIIINEINSNNSALT